MYLKGLHLGIGPSSPVVISVHLLNLQENGMVNLLKKYLTPVLRENKQINTDE